MKYIILFTLISLNSALAGDLHKLPKSFALKSDRAVFADFTHAHYDITYDYENKTAMAVATIDLVTIEDGHIIFDSHNEPEFVSLNGIPTEATLIETPNRETSLRIVDLKAQAGIHQLKIELPITQLVEFTNLGVKSAFWMSDLTERGYLERYLPTNFLFDRIPTTFNVKFVDSPTEQNIYANGEVQKISRNEFKVRFPDGLNSTCLYFHTVPKGTTVETRFSYQSVDGRNIPSIIYLQDAGDQFDYLESLKKETITIMRELEEDYGPFLHPSLTIYVAGSGGMEYSGATMTSGSALGHELFHSYFARGVMPSDGNSGWFDEALARWRDNGYRTIKSLSGSSSMADHGYYNRVTDRLAYSFGEKFMALINGKLEKKGGLKPFLRDMVTNHSFEPLSTQDFLGYLNSFFDMSFDKDFNHYVFGVKHKNLGLKPIPFEVDHIHRQLTLKELKELL